MVIERWTTAQVQALAPDAASAKAAQGLSGAAKWEAAGRSDGTLLWGLARGSGKKPYQACVDLAEPAYQCSCPSRKFPCKHALGLMLRWAATGVDDAPLPQWVAEWRDAREARAAKAAARKAEAGPVDEAAARRRAEQRADRVAGGVAELDRWLLDQVSQGLAGAERAGYAPYEAMAARLVDAQAPGAANAVRRLATVTMTGGAWADRLLGELALLRLLTVAHGRAAELPSDLVATVRSRLGLPVSSDDVLAGPRTRDRWAVLGQVDVADDRLTSRRTWLRGESTGRFALLLAFAAPGQTLAADVVPGTVVDADVCFYPGALPLRALIAARHAPAVTVAPTGAVPVRAALAGWAAAVAAEPWRGDVPVLLADVTPTGDGHVVDAAGDALPLATADEPWWLYAAAGGRPVTLAGEWSPGGLRPLAAWPGGVFVAATPGEGGARRRGPELPPALLSAALVGTARKPFDGASVDVGGRVVRLDGSSDGGSGDSGAAALLEAAAVALAYRRAGETPRSGHAPVEPAPPETAPPLPDAAATRLRMLLSGEAVPGGAEIAAGLLVEWLTHAARRRALAPSDTLPQLLDAGRRNRDLRESLAVVGGRRARWLAELRSPWQYLLAEAPDDPSDEDWRTGTARQRAGYLAAIRARDATAGLDLLAATFDAEAPDDRARLLGALRTGLGPADEPLLERALDDRRKEVRDVAADLLARLPGSALNRRMAARGLAVARLEKRVLGRGRVDVTPPEQLDAAARRDGLDPAPPRGTGTKAWLLHEIVRRVPLDTWTTEFGRTPAQVVATQVTEEWAEPWQRALAHAAVAQRHREFAALLVGEVAAPVVRRGRSHGDAVQLALQLYQVLPPADVAEHAIGWLRRQPQSAHRLVALTPGPWSPALADAVLDAVARLTRETGTVWHAIGELCRAASLAMPPEHAPHAERLDADVRSNRDTRYTGPAVMQLAAALRFRHEMHEELR